MARSPGSPSGKIKIVSTLRELYEGESDRASRFRYTLLLFDMAAIVFVVVTSFLEWNLVIDLVNTAIGLVILADFVARLAISRHRIRDLLHPLGLADMAAIASFLAPIAGQGFGFLRVLRTLRLFRSYRLTQRMRNDFRFVGRNHDQIVAATHLFVFLFVMTAVVYETQNSVNPEIGNYADALYFTVATLTTTGFGDITLVGTTGRLLSIVMMLVGVSLFIRMLQVLFRPTRVHHECLSCGLSPHEGDAVHCRRCGTLLHAAAKSNAA